MIDRSELRARANLTAARYFADFSNWPTPVLIEKLETLAYKLARDGDSREATGLFILVADLSQAKSEHSTSQKAVGSPHHAFESRTGGNHD